MLLHHTQPSVSSPYKKRFFREATLIMVEEDLVEVALMDRHFQDKVVAVDLEEMMDLMRITII